MSSTCQHLPMHPHGQSSLLNSRLLARSLLDIVTHMPWRQHNAHTCKSELPSASKLLPPAFQSMATFSFQVSRPQSPPEPLLFSCTLRPSAKCIRDVFRTHPDLTVNQLPLCSRVLQTTVTCYLDPYSSLTGQFASGFEQF